MILKCRIYIMSFAILWFKNDLRINDNPALNAAFSFGLPVVPIYIMDDDNIGSASKLWLHYSLKSLQENLNGNLKFFKENTESAIKKIIKQNDIKAFFWNRSYDKKSIDRDKKIKELLKQSNIKADSFNGSLIVEPWQNTKETKEPYKIFTPFYKNTYLNDYNIPKMEPKYNEEKNYGNIDTGFSNINDLNLLTNKKWEQKVIKNWNIGEIAANKKLANFLKNGIIGYREGRNYPAKNNVSKLSMHIHFGEISIKKIWHTAKQKITEGKDIETFLSEIGWREFSYHLLYHFPSLPEKNLQKNFDNFPWGYNSNFFEKWKKGQTGYPIVDAGMRELYQTGYMHNRTRMIVGSFLVKNLLIDWRHGAKWFWDCLFDADIASNSASWQWVSGCGTDASPYFRIFNPILQGQKFDPDGTYTKKYIPELSKIDLKYLFCPWTAPTDYMDAIGITLGDTYPKPIVDFYESKNHALNAYQKNKSNI